MAKDYVLPHYRIIGQKKRGLGKISYFLFILFFISCSSQMQEVDTERNIPSQLSTPDSVAPTPPSHPTLQISEIKQPTPTVSPQLTSTTIPSPTYTPTYTPTLFSQPELFASTETPTVCVVNENISGFSQKTNSQTTYTNNLLGIELDYPTNLQLVEDQQYLSDSIGFTLLDPSSPDELILRVGWLHQHTAGQLESKANETSSKFSEFPVEQSVFNVNGQEGILLAPVPGATESTFIYLSTNNGHLFELIIGKVPLDDYTLELLENIIFYEPSISIRCLNLFSSEEPGSSPNLDDNGGR